LEAMTCCSSCGMTLFEICWLCGPCRFIRAMPTLVILPFAAVTLTWMSPRPPLSCCTLPTTVWAPATLALPVVRAAVLAAVVPPPATPCGLKLITAARPAAVAAMTMAERFMTPPVVGSGR
jgi:hypothetical protein